MKLHIFGLMALAVAGLTSCEADKDPVLQEPTEFKVNTPPFVNQLYDLSPDGVMEITCSQPNYGLALASARAFPLPLPMTRMPYLTLCSSRPTTPTAR